MVDTKTLLECVDVAALIERDLGQPVRREGRWLKWTCPFHDDRKTPSLSRSNFHGIGTAGAMIS